MGHLVHDLRRVSGGGWDGWIVDWRWLFEVEGRISVGSGSEFGRSEGREARQDVGEDGVAFRVGIHFLGGGFG